MTKPRHEDPYSLTVNFGAKRMQQIIEYSDEKDIARSESIRRAWDCFQVTRLRERHAPETGGD